MHRNIILVLLLILSLNSCNTNNLKVNISEIDDEVKLHRFDQIMFNKESNNIDNISELNSANNFASIYCEQIINIGPINGADFINNLIFFQNEKMILEAKHAVDSTFTNTDIIYNELVSGFKHYKYYFPKTQIPDIYTYISGFNEAVVIGDGFVGISLDKYLGANCKFYPLLGIHNYKLNAMIPDKIPFDVLMGWVMNKHPKSQGTSTLIEEMIYQGKLMYLMDACFPESEDSLKIGYTKDQLNFCIGREADMWTYLIDQKLLFKTDRMLLKKFIYPAPYTNPFSDSSPGRCGVWIGWQIVRSYMENNPETTFEELMTKKSEKNILNDAKYFPE